MKKKLTTFLLALTFLFLFSGSSVVFADDLQDGLDAYERKDYETAHRLILPLAEQGNAGSQFYLGKMYDEGRGVPQDYKESVKWWKLAAEQGLGSAQYNMGHAYHFGTGVPQDDKEAVKWLKLAAEKGGGRSAQFNLGLTYDLGGNGVPQDYVLAYMWLNIAISNGYTKAINNIKLLKKQMSPSQIEKAQQLAQKKAEEIHKASCSKKFPKEKNMITVKGFYIGMNICEAKKLVSEGKYKSVFQDNGVTVELKVFSCCVINSIDDLGRIKSVVRAFDIEVGEIPNEVIYRKVNKIYFKGKLLHDLFKSKDMSLSMFSENFGKHYIKGKFMFEMEPHNDLKNNSIGYKYYNGEVGYKFFIKQNESGNGVESLTIEKVAKVSAGFGD